MQRSIVIALLVCLVVTLPGAAGDAYLIRFKSGFLGNGSYWLDQVLFHNANATPVQVRLLGVSNSRPVIDPPAMEIPPRRVMSLRDNWPVADRWQPSEPVPLYVQHLDVPSGVTVESRNEFWVVFPAEGGTSAVSKVSMPIVRELTQPNVPQVHLGADIGRTPSRINVGIYNAGSVAANAVIEVEQPCVDLPAATRRLTIAPNSVVQVAGLPSATPGGTCPYFGAPWGWVRTVTVRVDQPSLSFVTNIAERACVADGAAPCVGLSVPINTRF